MCHAFVCVCVRAYMYVCVCVWLFWGVWMGECMCAYIDQCNQYCNYSGNWLTRNPGCTEIRSCKK